MMFTFSFSINSFSSEIRLLLIIFIVIIIIKGHTFVFLQIHIPFINFLFPIYITFVIRILTDINRAPFDAAEGESELTLGFNFQSIE